MAGKKAEIGNEYRNLLEAMRRELEGGCEPDEFSLCQLRAANKSLIQCARHDKKGLKWKMKNDGGKMIRCNAALAVWIEVLYHFCQYKAVEVQEFQTTFTMKGKEGFDTFISKIRHVVFESIDKEVGLTPNDKAKYKEDFAKPNGRIDNIAQDMKHHIWENLVNNLDSTKVVQLGNPALHSHKKGLLLSWSKELLLAKEEANVKYANKVMQFRDVQIESAKRGVRPSRCIPNVRSLHFLRPGQIKNIKPIGKGAQGDVHTCHVLDCPLIPKNVILVAKRFKEGNKHKRRADALQEVLMGGLDHRGIIGALGITIQDPPRLVYDYYNGGDLRSFIDKCEKWNRGKGKSQSQVYDFEFMKQQKLFLHNRLALSMALLETMQFFHQHGRVHCDFHEGNIMLHFDYEGDNPIKVYIGICDFGTSKTFSQCHEPEHRIWSTPTQQVASFRKDNAQLALELVGPTPSAYSLATDVYSMGNILETLLTEDWDGMSKFNRFLVSGWKAQNDGKRLEKMIAAMMNSDPTKRLDCGYWVHHMKAAFPDCKLYAENSRYLKD